MKGSGRPEQAWLSGQDPEKKQDRLPGTGSKRPTMSRRLLRTEDRTNDRFETVY